jgi:hypothetical protein
MEMFQTRKPNQGLTTSICGFLAPRGKTKRLENSAVMFSISGTFAACQMQLGLNILAMCVSALPFLVLIAWFLVRIKAPALGAELLKYILPSHTRK